MGKIRLKVESLSRDVAQEVNFRALGIQDSEFGTRKPFNLQPEQVFGGLHAPNTSTGLWAADHEYKIHLKFPRSAALLATTCS